MHQFLYGFPETKGCQTRRVSPDRPPSAYNRSYGKYCLPESDPLPESYEDDVDTEDTDLFEEESVEKSKTEEERNYPDNLLEVVMDQYKKSKDKLIKGEIRDVVKSYGKFSDLPREELEKAFDLLNMPF